MAFRLLPGKGRMQATIGGAHAGGRHKFLVTEITLDLPPRGEN